METRPSCRKGRPSVRQLGRDSNMLLTQWDCCFFFAPTLNMWIDLNLLKHVTKKCERVMIGLRSSKTPFVGLSFILNFMKRLNNRCSSIVDSLASRSFSFLSSRCCEASIIWMQSRATRTGLCLVCVPLSTVVPPLHPPLQHPLGPRLLFLILIYGSSILDGVLGGLWRQ